MWLTLAAAAVGVFAVYTYVSATLTQVSGMPLALVPAALALFSLGMTAGDLVGARLADRALLPTVAAVLLWDAAVGVVYGFAAHDARTAAG